MSQKTLTVLLVEDDPDYAELVQHWISDDAECGFVLNWTDSLSAAVNRLAQGNVDLILLDLGLPDSDGAETFLHIKRRMPGIPVVILSAADSETLAVHLIREGAEDYLVKNACNAEVLMRALRHGMVRYKSRGPAAIAEGTLRQARVMGVVGSKGGVGTTTVACSLAAEVARQTGQKVLLMDLDITGGMIPFLMSLDPKFSLLDLIRKEHVDRDCWEAVVQRGSHDLDIVSLPGLDGNDQITPEDVGQVLAFAGPGYGWVVLDLGRFSSFSMNVLDRMHEVCLITTTSIASLYEAKRAVDRTLKSQRIGTEGLHLIVNLAGEPKSLTGGDLRKIFGIEVYAKLPFDGHELHQACIERRLPGETSQFGKEIARLAQRLSGAPERRSQSFAPLVSFAERFRRASSLP